MKIFLTVLCMIISLAVASAANAYPLGVWVSMDEYADHGDFIIYNNTAYTVELSSDGWKHQDIFAGGNIQPYSVRVDSAVSLKGSDNGGTLNLYPLGGSATWIKIHAYTEKTNNQTYWDITSGSSSTGRTGAPPVLTNSSNVIQLLDGNLVYTFFMNLNHDKGGTNYSSGNTKVVLTISDWTTVDFSQMQNTQGW